MRINLHLILFLFVLFAISSVAQTVYIRDGNVFLSDDKAMDTQLTFNGNNSEPVLSPDKSLVAFVHTLSGDSISTGTDDGLPTELWTIKLEDKKLEKLVDPNNSNDMKLVIASISNIQFSNDSKIIFFLSDAWVTSNAVHKVNIQTKVEKFVSPGNSLEVLREGKYKGNIKVNQHRYHQNGGTYDCDYILTPDGREITVVKGSCDE
jgi:hypothetical protein